MTTVKIPISVELSRRLTELKNTLGKSKRVIMREALEDYIVRHERRAQGFEYILVRTNDKQQKLDLK